MPHIESFIIGLSGVIIMMLLGVVSFFFKRTLDSMDKLSATIIGLRATLSAQETSLNNLSTQTDQQITEHEKWLLAHEKQLVQHDKELALINQNCITKNHGHGK